MVAILSCSCNAQSAQEKPSGLKNMAPPPIQEAVQDDLDVEPNNTFLQATEITMTADAMQWSGTLDHDDVDVWHIKAKAGTIAHIHVTPEDDFDILADYSMSGKDEDRRFYDVARSHESEILPNIRLTPQGGYLTVRARTDKTEPLRYRVSLTRLESADYAIEAEIDDSRETAMLLPAPSTIEGSVYPSGDVDYYRVHLSTPAIFSFTMPDGVYEIAIENRDQTVWTEVSKSAQMIKTGVIMPDAQDFYLRVKSLEAVRELKTYQLAYQSIEKVPDEIEPNNTIEKAQVIQGETQSLEFSLLDEIDVDIFKVVLDSAHVYRVRLVGPQTNQANLQVLTSQGAVRTDTLSEAQTACDVRATEGAIWLKVSGESATWPLPYRIAIDAEDEKSVEMEPNQTPDQATALSLDRTIYGHIFPAGDVDLYRIEVPSYPNVEGPVGTLEIDVEAGYVAQLQLKLQDAQGYEILQGKNEQLSRPIHLAFDAPSGVYLLALSGSGDSCLKPYALRAAFKPNPAAIADIALPTPSNAPPKTVDIDPAQPETAQPAAEPDIDAILKAAETVDEDAF